MRELGAVSFVHRDELESVIDYCNNKKYRIFFIDGTQVITLADFFYWIKTTMPQDPPLSGRINFDALVDSLWGGLESSGESKIAVIWIDVNKFMDCEDNRFDLLCECFEELSTTLRLESYGVEQPVMLNVILLGQGEEFHSFT